MCEWRLELTCLGARTAGRLRWTDGLVKGPRWWKIEFNARSRPSQHALQVVPGLVSTAGWWSQQLPRALRSHGAFQTHAPYAGVADAKGPVSLKKDTMRWRREGVICDDDAGAKAVIRGLGGDSWRTRPGVVADCRRSRVVFRLSNLVVAALEHRARCSCIRWRSGPAASSLFRQCSYPHYH